MEILNCYPHATLVQGNTHLQRGQNFAENSIISEHLFIANLISRVLNWKTMLYTMVLEVNGMHVSLQHLSTVPPSKMSLLFGNN